MNRCVSSAILPLVILGTASGLFGCEKSEIQSYRAPREFRGTPETAATLKPADHEHIVDWNIPDDWTELETTSSMRIATFQANNTQEIAVTAFPGDVGGLIANVNRWREQVGVEAITETQIEDSIERVAGSTVIIVDIQGETNRLLGSIINIGDGQTWFAKATGPDEMIGNIKDDLVAFSVSFRPHDHSAHANEDSQHNHADHAAPEISTDWELPSEWTPEQDFSNMLLAAFTTDSGGRVTMSELVGDGGGVIGNVNRWRNQLGLPIVATEAELGLEKMGQGSVIVDILSPNDEDRMMAAIVPIGSRTLFFKLTGKTSAVEAEMERFRTCVQMVGVANEVLP